VGWLVGIPLLPAIAFAVMLPMSRQVRDRAGWLALLAMSGSLGLSLVAFLRVAGAAAPEGAPVYEAAVRIATLDGVPVAMGIRLDAMSAALLLVVTIVGLCVEVYSLGYMHTYERRGWYFAVLSLFSAAMLTVVLAGDFLMLYMAWEVMGLCSYLLIGFWHEQEGPRLASLKAFLTTRVGDVAFALALAIMWTSTRSFDYAVVLGEGVWSARMATAVALLLLVGAMGKSAQVPLHVWLPDAMAGPTPASALIHAATMVAAGVYLVARAMPIFQAASPVALGAVLVVGLTTVLVGGLLAAVQYDIKKVLAYSTISQLGYMFVALGAGSQVAAMFHLTTHAFFKSLLFLAAGVIIHSTKTQDIREMGGLRRVLPWTTATFTAGALALAGVFPFSGFFSKDEILATLLHRGMYVPLGLALLGALITSFYVARLWFRVFGTSWACSRAREGHPEMLAPMVLLALVTLGVGFASPAFASLLGEHAGWPESRLALASSGVAAVGLLAGWWVYGRRAVDTDGIKRVLAPAYAALMNNLYFDHAYRRFVVSPYQAASAVLARWDERVVDGAVNGVAAGWRAIGEAGWRFDGRVIDGAVNGAASLVVRAGKAVKRIQVGHLQSYQRFAYTAIVFFILWMMVQRGV
jgi:NADH-quinone oxidoreductase subunit L